MNFQIFFFVGVMILLVGCIQSQNPIGNLQTASDDWGQNWNQVRPDCDLSKYGWTLDNNYYPITFRVPSGENSPDFQFGNGWHSSSFELYCHIGAKSGENTNYLYCDSSQNSEMKIQKEIPAVVLSDGTIQKQAHIQTFNFDKDDAYVVLNLEKMSDGTYSAKIIKEFCSTPSIAYQPTPTELDFSTTTCEGLFGNFTILDSKVAATQTKFLIANTGQNVSFTGATITGTNAGPMTYNSGEVAISVGQNGVLILTPANALETGAYNLTYTLQYKAGALTGLAATGSCNGEVKPK